MAGQDIGVFRRAQLFDQGLLLRDGGGPVGEAALCRDPVEPRGGMGEMQVLDGADQRLGGDAAEVHAGAAKGAGADQRHPRPGFGGGDGGGKPGRAGADHGEVGGRGAIAGAHVSGAPASVAP